MFQLTICLLFVISSVTPSSLSNSPQIILLNSNTSFLETYTISLAVSQTFKIITISAPMTQIYNISLICNDSQTIHHLIANPRICNSDFVSQELSSESIYTNEKVMGISFYGNSFDSHCFDLISRVNLENDTMITYKILFNLAPVQTILELNTPFEFEMNKGLGKDFIYNVRNCLAKILHIQVKSKASNSSDNKSNEIRSIKLRHPSGLVCIDSDIVESWLCDISSYLGQIIEFSLFQVSDDSGSYEISIASIDPKRVDPNFKAISYSTIPGFGAIYNVPLHLIGHLQIKANDKFGNYLPIIIANSISRLFGVLLQYQNQSLLQPYIEDQGNQAILIENDNVNTQWYYYIGNYKLEKYLLTSCFMQRVAVDSEDETIYYIKLQGNAYQYIELIFNQKDFDNLYEASVETLKSDNSIDLFYYVSNPFIPSMLTKLSGMRTYSKKASLSPYQPNKLSLFFQVPKSESIAYLATYAVEEGLYKIIIKKTGSKSLKNIIFIYILVSFVITGIFLLIAKIFSIVGADSIYKTPKIE